MALQGGFEPLGGLCVGRRTSTSTRDGLLVGSEAAQPAHVLGTTGTHGRPSASFTMNPGDKSVRRFADKSGGFSDRRCRFRSHPHGSAGTGEFA